jgi:hypothetical protein
MSTTTYETTGLEDQISHWRSYLLSRQVIHAVDVAELEDHLRQQLAALVDSGLAPDEAFLVAVKRMGSLDALSREFAREHSERLWKQLVMVSATPGTEHALGTEHVGISTDTIVAFSLAAASALAIKVPALLGLPFGNEADGFYLRNLSLFVLPLLAVYFAWKRRLSPRMFWSGMLPRLTGVFVAAAFIANIFTFPADSHTQILLALHLPIGLWLVVGIAYAGKRWNEVGGRMDFIRFSGELFIYYVLVALGGGVLTAFTAMVFGAIGIDMEPFLESWLLPCGAMAAVIIASWLVEAKQSVIENMAPVLTRLFTPLFAAMLMAFLVAMLWTGRVVQIEREVLIAFDLLLVVVLGLLLYSISARDSQAVPGIFDVAQVVLVLSALLADTLALWAIAARISEFGASPNRAAALGVNLILLVNLAWSAVLYIGFLRGRGSFTRLERWQTGYLPVYAAWAVVVVVVFPPLFGYR